MSAPALAEVPEVDHQQIARLVDELEPRPPRAAIFQTGVGTRALFEATDTLGNSARLLALLSKSVVVARGPKPTGALRSRRVRIDRSAAEPYTTTQVLESLGDLPLRGERVLVQRYGETNVELEKALRAKGAEVVEIPTYRAAGHGPARRAGSPRSTAEKRRGVHQRPRHNPRAGAPERTVPSREPELHRLRPSDRAARGARELRRNMPSQASPPKLGPPVAASKRPF